MDYPKSTPNVGLHNGKFTDGTPDGSVKPSLDTAAWANAVTDSILEVQKWTGEAPKEDDITQLARGIDTRIRTVSAKGYKVAVRVVATSNIALNGLQTIDGVALAVGDRVLVTAQADGRANGIYVAGAGAWVRSADADDGDDLTPATVVPVIAGTQAGDALWLLSSDTAVTIGDTATAWQRVGGDGLPLGSVIMHSGPAAPAGYLVANGAAVARATYAQLDTAMYVGDAANATAPAWYRCTDSGNPTGTRAVAGAYLVLPDYRGVVLRGLDLGRGLDPDGGGRVVNSYQADMLGSHAHNYLASAAQLGLVTSSGGGSGFSNGTGIAQTAAAVQAAGGAETRGRNTAVLVCIKAFSAPTNQGLIDITALANEVAELAARGYSLGNGQTWQSVKAARSLGVTYYNTTGRPIMVAVALHAVAARNTISIAVDGVVVSGSAAYAPAMFTATSAVVPPGSAYVVSHSDSAAMPSIGNWVELR